MRLKFFFAAFAVLAAMLLSAAQAAPITYKLTGVASGMLGGTNFADQNLTWTITSDTSLQQPIGDGLVATPAGKLSLNIAGIGPIQPTSPIYVTSAVFFIFPDVLFVDFNNTQGIDFFAPQLAFYNGIAPIGPIPVTFRGGLPLSTAQGDLTILSLDNLVFQALVPEPLTLTLFGAGLAGLGAIRRRRKAIA